MEHIESESEVKIHQGIKDSIVSHPASRQITSACLRILRNYCCKSHKSPHRQQAMAMSLSRLVVAISGAGSGIGQGTAQLFSRLGACLSLADLDYQSVKSQAESIQAGGGTCLAFRVDVKDTQAVTSWIKQTEKALGKLDGSVNCAGVCKPMAKESLRAC